MLVAIVGDFFLVDPVEAKLVGITRLLVDRS